LSIRRGPASRAAGHELEEGHPREEAPDVGKPGDASTHPDVQNLEQKPEPEDIGRRVMTGKRRVGFSSLRGINMAHFAQAGPGGETEDGEDFTPSF
jgi:hypothetical protein